MHHDTKTEDITEPIHHHITEIPKTFQQGHEKDIPDTKYYLEHNKFEGKRL